MNGDSPDLHASLTAAHHDRLNAALNSDLDALAKVVGEDMIYVSSFGEITLVLEIADSMSGETLARAAERRALTPLGGGGDLGLANSVTTWAEVRRTSRTWATRLREGLDAFHDGSIADQ